MNEHLERLVNQIDHPLSPAVRQAFLEVDRGWFVPFYYRREGKEWVQEETRGYAYTDSPLTTKIERGRPVSSSSMPSVMAAMLEALEIQPAQKVLEIGTGTGYNAAIMSKIVGKSGHILSVERDEDIGRSARERLLGASIENVHVTITDGFLGYQPEAPYQRIIATAAFHQFPRAWQEQLATGGIFVGNLLGHLTSILIRLEKQEDGSLKGSPVPHGAFFMEMRSPHLEEPASINWTCYECKSIDGEYTDTSNLAGLLRDQAFLLFLQCLLPATQIQKRYNGGPIEHPSSFETWLIDSQEHTSVIVKTETIQSRGHGFWGKVQEALFQWEERKRPAIEAYSIIVSPQGEMNISIPSE
jgi:protein-L-isoaspartate(D-aspartate) O-methyltransferase